MIKIELTKKFKKKLYDINQDMKTLFFKYNIYPDNIIISNNLDMPSFHGAKLIDRIDFPDEFDSIVLSLHSRQIYDVYSDHKSELDYIFLVNGFIYLGNDETKYEIGSYYSEDGTNSLKFVGLKQHTTEIINEFNPTISLDSEKIEKLYKGSLIKIAPENKKYKTRLSKGVVPGLKKSSLLDIEFHDHEENDFLYFITLRNTRNKVYTYHERMCIVIKAKD